MLFQNCESHKKTVKLFGLTFVVFRDLCNKLGDLGPRKFDLTLNYASNKRLSHEEGQTAVRRCSSKKVFLKL